MSVRYVCLVVFHLAAAGLAMAQPVIFPEPQQMKLSSEALRLDDAVPVIVSPGGDIAAARQFAAELSDRYGVAARVERRSTLPSGRFILIGAKQDPLVRASGLNPPDKPEGYALRVTTASAIVAGNDAAGAFYGMQSLRQLLHKSAGTTVIRGGEVLDWPHLPFRGIRMYLPGHENLAFFRRFLRDFMALYKFNKLILEVNGSMRLDSHPEVNAGWLDFARDLFYSQRYYPRGPNGVSQNSAHHDTADGEILEKDEVSGIARIAAEQHIEIVPEIPTFTHSYYLLTRHKDFSAIAGAEWPDTYDPSNPAVYKLVFDVMDEYIELFHPKIISIGHDEMFFPVEACPSCQKRDPALLFADDVRKLHDHLSAKGIRTAMYGDHLVESVRGVHRREAKSETGWAHTMPGALTADQVRDLIPKDVLVLNWFWQDARANVGRGEKNDVRLSEWGFQQVHANFASSIENYARRSTRAGVIGGAPSSWSATNEFTIGKDLMIDFLGTANLMWSTHWPDEERLSKIVQSMMPDVRRRLSGKLLPGEAGDALRPIEFNGQNTVASELPAIAKGRLATGSKIFQVQSPVVVGVAGSTLPLEAVPIHIGADASSIVFLHASAKPAANDMSYRYIHNFPDTADLLGWYEVIYEDGFTDSVPVRYGWNILPVTWGAKSDVVAKGSANELSYAYAADFVSHGATSLFAYEWVNPRFGKPIKEIRLHGTSGFRSANGKPTPENAIILAAVSITPKRQPLARSKP